MTIKTTYAITLAGFFTVLAALVIWPVCCANDDIPFAFRWGLLVTPMLFPIPGLIKGKAYTFAWSHFLALLYFIIAIVTLWQGDANIYGSFLLVGSLSWFSCALLYIRLKSRQMQAQSSH